MLYNWIQNKIMTFFYWVFPKMMSELKKVKYDSYASKYYTPFNEMETTMLSYEEKVGLNEVFVNDCTEDNDTIIMSYNNLNDCFYYWCDKTNVSFQHLDAVAQLYALENKCKEICVNYKEEIEKAKMKRTVKKQTVQPIKENSPFATFKRYNLTEFKQPTMIPEKCNQFRKKGNINDWEKYEKKSGNLQKSVYSENAVLWKRCISEPRLNNLSYKEWKENNH
jgi:hypothetical protein